MEQIQIIGVDNILNKVLDPIQIGFTSSENLVCSCKAVAKRDAVEKVGVIGKRNGHYDIVEYSELSDAQANEMGSNGQLRFNQGSILVFMISAQFLVDLVTSTDSDKKGLYHRAFKKVSHVDPDTWDEVTPDAENAWKFELFLHNFMPQVPDGKLGVLMVDRDTEFAAVKNADGSDANKPLPDTPAFAKMMYLRESQAWLQQVQGLKIGGSAVGKVEVSPLLSYAGENMNWLKHIFKKSSIGGEGGYLDHAGNYTSTE